MFSKHCTDINRFYFFALSTFNRYYYVHYISTSNYGSNQPITQITAYNFYFCSMKHHERGDSRSIHATT